MEIEETSAGVIIFNILSNKRFFLILNYPSGHWDFVKGKMEVNEKPLETAIREAKEETGVKDLEFIDGFKKIISYDFQFEEKIVHKKVIFFLAKTFTREICLSHEHLNFTWLPYEEALKKVTYQNARKVLEDAEKLLEQRKIF